MSVFGKILRWSGWLLGILFLLVVVYGIGRLIHVAQGSIYHGERAPYLQMASASAINIRWQSPTSYRGVVRYGLTPDKLTSTTFETESRQAHEVRLTKLQAQSRYYYAVGAATDQPLQADPDNWFITSPDSGAPVPVRFLVLGDPGLAIPGQRKVIDAALTWLNGHPRPQRGAMDMLLTTGDNAYRSGKNEEFQQNFFAPFKTILRNVPVWPIYGNHDARRWSFFEIFTFPTRGESGGVASGTEHYYSFDYGQVHFVVLDSQDSRWNDNREMVSWLRNDLVANQLPWVISLFHHPPYSKGSHDSDSHFDSSGRMVDMRENILPVLEKHGVDLVLSGHSHMYERSYLMDCYYGDSDVFNQSAMVGRQKQHYQKRSLGKGPHEGTIYAVVGSTARADYGPLDHPAMATALMETGSLIVDINGSRLDGRFISGEGIVADHFSITKGVKDAPVGACRQ